MPGVVYSEILDRVRKTKGLASTGGAAEFTILARPQATPAAWVLLLGINVDNNGIIINQTEQYMVIIEDRTVRDKTGEKAINAVLPVSEAIRNRLDGWRPRDDCSGSVQYISGEVQRFDDGLISWGDQYQIERIIRSPYPEGTL